MIFGKRYRVVLTVWALVAALAGPGKGPLGAERGELISGVSTVVDGDTLRVGGERIRLFGIDAPESDQVCQARNIVRCGDLATAGLRRMIGGSAVRCVVEDVDRYGRLVSVCYLGNDDLNARMVRSGLAVAYRQYSERYVDEEAAARRERRGLWGTRFVMPWEWRRGERLQVGV